MSYLIKILAKSGLLKDVLDYHLVRASMVLIYVLFGYQKWFEYEAGREKLNCGRPCMSRVLELSLNIPSKSDAAVNRNYRSVTQQPTTRHPARESVQARSDHTRSC